MRSIFAAVALVGVTNAWWEAGHLITAKRAEDILHKQNPDVLAAA